jgi:hypothetical protein
MATAKKAARDKGVRLHCNDCRGNTLHELPNVARDEGSEVVDGQYGIWWETVHEMFECYGCKSVVVRRTHIFSEWDGPDVQFFPQPASRHKPEWFHWIPNEMRSLLQEIYKFFDANTTALPLMGARSLLDLLIISQKNREILEAALDAGCRLISRGRASGVAD